MDVEEEQQTVLTIRSCKSNVMLVLKLVLFDQQTETLNNNFILKMLQIVALKKLWSLKLFMRGKLTPLGILSV